MSEDKNSRAPVIQIIKGAELTKSEQLLNRVLPACVASAGIHVLLAAGVFALSSLAPVGTKAAEPDKVEVAVEESNEKPEDKNLTETTPSIDESSTTVVIEEAKLDTNTVQSNVTENIPAGAEGTQTTPTDVLNQLGKESNAILPGLEAVGPGAGMAKGSGNEGLGAVSANLAGRQNQGTKATLLKTGGGNAESELAVARGLNWLAKQQVKDVGCWVYDKGNEEDTVSATGFALLPFLAAGQTHKVVAPADTKYKKTVQDGLNYLLKCQKPDGSFRFGKQAELNMYSNAIATVAISEAYGMTGDKTGLMEPLQRAVNFIESAQSSNGSWNYTVKTDGDTSIVGWQVQALHSAKLCKGIKVNAKVLEKAGKFLDSVASGSSKYKYGYRDASSGAPTTTAVGLLCRYYLNGWGPNSAAMRDGADYLMKSHKPGEKTYDMYYYYYATQVMHFYGGDTWNKEWNPAMRDFLLKQQVKEPKNIRVDGSWDPDKGLHMGPQTGRLGTTAMVLLTLEVYYRHLPLYGRGTGAMSDLDGK